jgi:tetratricopeptide (TPR) repeat protein
MDEGLKARLLAETKFLRALYYWNLVNLWGNVPLQLTPSNPNVLPEHAAEAEVWAQIIQDLIEAQPLLPDSYPESELGRATSGAAAALLGKCYMQLHRWAEAEAEFAKIIASGKYDLVQNYGDNFKHTTENNIESLFEIQFSDEFSGPFWDKDLPNTSEGYRRATYFAPRFASGNADAHATPWYLEQFFLEKTVDGEYDPRMDVSFLWNDTTNGQTDPHYYGKSFRDEMTVNVNDIFSRKYLTDYYREVEDEHSPINFRVIRFADVLLMHAEALNELNRTGEAYPFINRVRQRSNLAALETVKPNMSQDEMREQIKHERVLELGGEQVRWTD